jgi:hypothetical protein
MEREGRKVNETRREDERNQRTRRLGTKCERWMDEREGGRFESEFDGRSGELHDDVGATAQCRWRKNMERSDEG